MTIIEVNPGACGMMAVVRAQKSEPRQAGIQVETECKMVAALAAEVTELGFREIFKPMDQNLVIQAAGRHRLHAVCPLPCAILKAAEAEMGLALKKDVQICYRDEEAK